VSAEDNKKLVRRFFDAMSRGDASLPDLMADDVAWWVPPGANLGGLYEGKAKVLGLMAGGIDLYDRNTPMQVEIEQLVAEGEWVTVQMVLSARTARGEDYRNHYHFAFRVRDGRIALVKEYVDTLYADRKLFAGAAR
jgi:ketosteroid isomerase-like protein